MLPEGSKAQPVSCASRTIKTFALAAVFFASSFFSISCSVPNLEAPECAAARGVAKEFYSYHFGNEMKFSAETLKPRERFLTPELAETVRNSPVDSDPFTTRSTDIPKAFRIGGCKLAEPTRAEIEVILFWRDDSRSEERKIRLEAVRRNDKWLINKLLN